MKSFHFTGHDLYLHQERYRDVLEARRRGELRITGAAGFLCPFQEGAGAMAVFRVEKNRNFTVMSNYHLQDKRISLKSCAPVQESLSCAGAISLK